MTAPAHIHLQPLGGVAGDMFMSAMVAGWPELAAIIRQAVIAAGVPGGAQMAFKPVKRKGLAAIWLDFDPHAVSPAKAPHHYRDIRQNLINAPLAPATRDPALAILHLIAAAEAKIHGIDIEAVHFHEVADWDSVADVVAAGAIIGYFEDTTWSCAPLPLGGGQVDTAHGRLPVPAPATQILMTGLSVVDDGIYGERVTPTGAAIVQYLLGQRGAAFTGGKVAASGFGAGTRDSTEIANVLRVAGFDAGKTTDLEHDHVVVIGCEIDDMTPEELAAASDGLRAEEGVLDVSLFQGIGKKGRAIFHLQVLCQPADGDRIAGVVLQQTTTLGLRQRIEERHVVARNIVTAPSGVRVKRAERGQGVVTAKAEADDLDGAVFSRRMQSAEAENAILSNANSLKKYDTEG